ncbi:MAG: hypothetical protein M1831_003784 [Alyxoria varia]|nr:MAG: hypothetical protein M1831_003784 [Alyxoria varia]
MAARSERQIPGTRVISPSPTPTEPSTPAGKDYFGPVTRSSTRNRTKRVKSPPPIDENSVEEDTAPSPDPDYRARSRSRSADVGKHMRRMSGLTPSVKSDKPEPNGHLSPADAARSYWREISRSPSPLGLIPIHREWRSFIHRHEIPRKFLHISIGFITLGLYASGWQKTSVYPALFYALVPIAFFDFLRHNWPPFNRTYIRTVGAFMRETEAHDRYNGVIWFLLGTWSVLWLCPKDVATMSVVLLSWCDTAASTIGRLCGKYTPRVRRGKSLAGSLAGCAVGIATSALFWGWIAPRYEAMGIADNTGINSFAFKGRLALPDGVRNVFGLSRASSMISGGLALGVMSICTGLIASASEAVDIFGLDDNVTIPVLCGAGLWGFLKVFGNG